jgi:uncharacterized protein YggT (Ycf19 family)
MILISGLIGIVLLGLFLGIMLWWVPAPPLIAIVVAVMLLLIYDFVRSVRQNGDRK